MSQWGKSFSGTCSVSGIVYEWEAVPHYDSVPFTNPLNGAVPDDVVSRHRHGASDFADICTEGVLYLPQGGEDLRAICPKCGSDSAWFEYTPRDVVLRCLCGIRILVQTHLGEIVIEHSERPEDISLPREGTKLWHCLAALAALRTANTAVITSKVNSINGAHYDTNEVSSHLTVLRYKGLVVVTEYRKGLPGGSTWVLTPAASKLLKREQHGIDTRRSPGRPFLSG